MFPRADRWCWASSGVSSFDHALTLSIPDKEVSMGRECQLCFHLSPLAEQEQAYSLDPLYVSSLTFPSYIRYLVAWESECVLGVLREQLAHPARVL